MPSFHKSHKLVIAALLAVCVLPACASSDGADQPSDIGPPVGFYMSGRFLYDPCGNKVVLRGVNEMIVWSSGMDGIPEYAEIAKTGANVVRIVWNATGSASALDTTISNALAEKLIPMVENHDATGDITKVPAAVDYWLKQDVLDVLKKYEDRLLLNIANEAGDGNVTKDEFENTYKTAISRVRGTGLTVPLVIDSISWGVNIVRLFESGPTLIEADPLHNVLLSVHTYWDDDTGETTRKHMANAAKQALPLIVGEFADTKVGVCTPGSYNVQALMEATRENEIGWLAWSWGGVKNNDCPGLLDMTSDGTFAGLQDWGLAVATTDPNSIQNTSVRSPYIENGACD
jgi:mannan endo-1,4-beta-mannosidase